MEEAKTTKFRFKKTVAAVGGVFLAVFFVFPVLAQTPELNLGLEYVDYTGLANTDIRMIVAKIIRAALGLLGIVALSFTIYGGYVYMTAGGNEEKIDTAKKILKNMAIGLAIILSALAIVQFIISAIYSEYAAKYGDGDGTGGIPGEYIIGGYLGPVIESHYPKRNAPWPGEPPIPRNTQIFITFRQPILASTLIDDVNQDKVFGNAKDGISDQINSVNLKIYPTAEGEAAALGLNPNSVQDDVYAYLSADERTIVLRPVEFLGHYLNEVNYTVKLAGGAAGVKLKDGASAFPGAGGHYSWQFTVSPIVDLTPPEVVSVIPVTSANPYSRNIIVQITFNEAVNPISSAGFFQAGDSSKNFQNIALAQDGGSPVSGEYKIGNQYRTVEFVSFDQCGINPCGQPIFCLPANAELTATAKSASVDAANPPQAAIGGGIFNGVVDAAGNSLNGGGEMGRNKKTDYKTLIGHPADNFWWEFSTSEAINATDPELSSIAPSIQAQGVSANAPLTFTFDKPMSLISFAKILLKTNKNFNVWHTPAGYNFTSGNQPADQPGEAVAYTRAELLHGPFWQTTSTLEVGAVYYPFVPSAVIDIYQNCFYPAVGPGAECAAGSGTDKLNDSNPSCYNAEASAGASLCAVGEVCPFSPAPQP